MIAMEVANEYTIEFLDGYLKASELYLRALATVYEKMPILYNKVLGGGESTMCWHGPT
jgi:hypothetical protein